MIRAGLYPADLDLSRAYTLQFVNRGVGTRHEATGASPLRPGPDAPIDRCRAVEPLLRLRRVSSGSAAASRRSPELDLDVRPGEWLSLLGPRAAARARRCG